LSHNRGVGFVCCIFMYESIPLSRATSHAPFTSPRYSYLVNEIATVCCFSLIHVTALIPRLETYLEVDFLSSIDPAQYQSVYPKNQGSLLLLYIMPNSSAPFTYLNMLFTIVQCSTFDILMNLEMKLKLKSGLVAIRYINIPNSCF
jgi:hypothetical protein